MKRNRVLSRPFLETLFWKQNRHHRHGVLMHTLRVFFCALAGGDYRMLPAALLHDIGKPFIAYKKEEDVIQKEHSFTDHEELSYDMIKDWPFVSDYTKQLVRYHYLIRDILKHETKDPKRFREKKAVWDRLSPDMQRDLARFLEYDDCGKGKNKR